MKTLLLVRHIKSSWDDAALSDYDRPLRVDRIGDAAIIVQQLKKRKIKTPYIIYSSACRTTETTRLFCKAWGIDMETAEALPALYDCPVVTLRKVVYLLSNTYDTVAIIGHNPSLTDFANEILSTPILNLPTAGCAVVQWEANSWRDIAAPTRINSYVIAPKEYR